jgi:hypothetical protein
LARAEGEVTVCYSKPKANTAFRELKYAAETQELVLQGLIRAQEEHKASGNTAGKLTGTSNVHFAQK